LGITRSSITEVDGLVGDLVKRGSPSGREAEVAGFIGDWLRGSGAVVEMTEVVPGRPNVIARTSRGAGAHTLLLLGHTDTALPAAGWRTDPYRPTRDKGRLLGLGAADMKGGLAALMLALRELIHRDTWAGSIVFAGVIDEEAYSLGMKALLASSVTPTWGVLGESHYDDAVLGCVGKVLLKVVVHGLATHGSRPELGINAITEAARLVTALDGIPMGIYPGLGAASQCVLQIRGGPDAYVITVPDECVFLVNRHLVPGETDQHAVAQVNGLVRSLGLRARVDVTVEPPYYPPYAVAADAPLVETFSEVHQSVMGRPPKFGFSRGVCDANYLVADAGVPTIIFGPRGGNLHAADEWVDLSTVADAAAVYVALAERVLRT